MKEKITIAQRMTYILSNGEKITHDIVEDFPLIKIEQRMQSGEMIWIKGEGSTAMINPKYLAAVMIEDKKIDL